MELNKSHIEQIRKYFLAQGEDEQVLIQKNIEPASLADILPQLKQLFNTTDIDDASLLSLLDNIGAKNQLEVLKEIQADYYSHLAILYNSGFSNPDIIALVNAYNAKFFNELNFQKELTTAFRLTERANLKSIFRDNDTNLTNEEISLAFKLNERQQLKEQFRLQETKSTSTNYNDAKVIPFNWKQLAIAAAFIGIVLVSTFYIFDKPYKQQEIAYLPGNEKDSNLQIKTGISNQNNNVNTLLASNDITFTKIKKNVLTENSLGYASDEKIINVRLYDISQHISAIEKEILNISQNKNNQDPALHSLELKRDSLKSLTNTYKFDKSILSLYLLSNPRLNIYKIDSDYFMEIDKIYYECNHSLNAIPFTKITDDSKKKMIDSIKFINPE